MIIVFALKLELYFSAERRVSYSTADEESSPRGSHELIEEPFATTPGEKKGEFFVQLHVLNIV